MKQPNRIRLKDSRKKREQELEDILDDFDRGENTMEMAIRKIERLYGK